MPLVEYICPECGERKETLVRATAEAVADKCSGCGALMEKTLSAFNSATGSGGSGGGCAPRGGFS